jgi:hypothetical protein
MSGVKGKSGIYVRTKKNRTGFYIGHPTYNNTPEAREKMRLFWSKRTNYFSLHKFEGVKHAKWKGDKVGYMALHAWVNRKLGKPTKCSFCGRDGLKGSYIHWANISGKYKRDLFDWIRLCAKCHYSYDRK